MLLLAAALTRRDTGWLRQSPALARELEPVAGLLSPAEVACIQADWGAACDVVHRHTLVRAGPPAIHRPAPTAATVTWSASLSTSSRRQSSVPGESRAALPAAVA